MENKTVFIISYNQLPINFWKEYINLESAKVWHWRNPQLGLDNLTTMWPDIIIIDAYWAKTPYKEMVEKLLIKSKINTQIFCVTPDKQKEKNSIFINKKLTYSNLSVNLFDQLNAILNPDLNNDLKMDQSA